MTIPNIVKHTLGSFSQFIAPNICLVCSDLIDTDNYKLKCLCTKCFNRIPLIPNNNQLTTRLIGTLSGDEIAIDKAVGMINLKDNHDYMKLIHSLKYHNYRAIGYELGKELARYMEICGMVDFDIAMPVPIHSAKRRERGYNQADLIAKAIAEHFGIDYRKDIAKRSRYTTTQTKLGKELRSKNVSGVFTVADSKSVIGKTIVIADDVFTTGSTINSLALELLECGAKSVYAATLAVA